MTAGVVTARGRTTAVALGLAVGLALLLVLDALAVRLGLADGALPRLSGTSAWLLSRAAGVTAYLALALDVIFGLLVSTRAADRWIPRGRTVELHRWLSTVALSLTGVHAVALLADRFIRFDVLDLLVPFVSSYRSLAVGLGVLAAYAALLVHASFGWRKRLGPRTWRRLHALSFAAFAGALVHGLLAGSDRGAPAVQLLYAVTGGTVVALVALRLRRPARPGRASRAP